MNEVDGWQDTAAAADPVSLCLVLSLIRPPPLHLLLLLSLSRTLQLSSIMRSLVALRPLN